MVTDYRTLVSEAGRRILVVEDQRPIAADLENTLTKLGYLVVGNVSSSEEAIARSEELRPELVLVDVHLSGAMEVRDRFDVPVVYLADADGEYPPS